ncbi:MAG: hypothetical protein U9Q92_04520 [archaeon]|nr:hypothetical protein [archaeon]
MKKGQMLEILGFLTLVVVIVMSLLVLKFATISQKVEVMELTQESHENEYFNAGANTLIVITEPATNKTFVELMGLAGFLETSMLEFGPIDNPITVDVFEELAQRLDKIYGKEHWSLNIPHVPRYQIYAILLLDVSPSMEDEIMDIKKNIQKIIDEVEETTDRRVAFKLYFLPGGEYYRNQFKDIERNNPNFRAYVFNSCSLGVNKNEAWAKGMKCLIEDKVDEWGNITAKVGIILSDEPPAGCEQCGCDHYQGIVTEACCPTVAACEVYDVATCDKKQSDIQNLADKANEEDIKMNIFTLKSNPCELPSRFRDQCTVGTQEIPYTCSGEKKLIELMTDLSNRTKAKMFTIDHPNDVSKAIREIVLTQDIPPDEFFKLGSTPPGNTIIHSYTITAPTPIPGVYVNAILKQWN